MNRIAKAEEVEQQNAMLQDDKKQQAETCSKKFFKHLKEHILLVLTFSGVVAGVILGFSLRSANLSSDTIMLISFPGDILMRMLKMLILPLIVSSLITGVAVLDPKSSGKIGLYAIGYYLVTTILAAILGIILVVTIKPGDENTKRDVGEGTTTSSFTTQDAILDLIRNIFPENLLQATIQQGQSHYTYVNSSIIKNASSITPFKLKKVWEFRYKDNTNILGILTFCVAFAMIVSNMGRRAEIILHFFSRLK